MQMLTLDQVADRLGVCRRTAENLLAAGRLPRPVRFGRVRRWSDEQVNEFIAAEVRQVGGGHSASASPPRRLGRPRTE